jgi:hypothetical protein
MKDLSPGARELLAMGRDAGEPDTMALSRTRASLIARVGGGAAAVGATVAVATTAKAAHLAAPVAAAALPTAAAGTASIAPAAPVIASVPLIATPLAVKLAATVAVVVGLSGAAYRADVLGARATSPAKTTAAPSHSSGSPARAAAAPVSVNRAPEVAVQPPPLEAPALPEVATPLQRTPEPESARHEPVAIAAPSPSLAETAGRSLALDVASLREAQAALVAGDAQGALDAVRRIDAHGPLAEEREGVRILAGCALGAEGAVSEAKAFVEQRPGAPVALRVRAACLGDK